MRILVLSWRDPKHPLSGGAEQVMHKHMSAWVKDGNEVTLFSSFFLNAKKTEYIEGVKIIRRGNQLLGVQLCAFFWYLFGKHKKYDLVVDQFHGIPFFTPLYVSSPKLAVVQEVAREVWFLNELKWPFNIIVGPLGYYLEPYLYKIYKNIDFMTGSLSAKNDLISIGIKENLIHVINHGVSLEGLKTIYKKEKVKTVLFLGAITKDKGIYDAIKTFSILSKKGKYNFWIVGRGPLNIDGKLPKNTKFWGFVSEEKKFELLSKAHVLINPSRREGWGLVNIEANASGTPVVAYNAAGLVDSVKNGASGIIVKQNTPKALAESVVSLLSEKSKYSLTCKSSIDWSKKFTWSVSTKKSLNLIYTLHHK